MDIVYVHSAREVGDNGTALNTSHPVALGSYSFMATKPSMLLQSLSTR